VSVLSLIHERRTVTWSPSSLMILHHAGRDGRRRAGHTHAGTWVDDGDGISSAHGGWLMEFHLVEVALESRRSVCVARGRRERNGRGDLLGGLDLMLQRRGVWRATGQRGSVGSRRVNGMQLGKMAMLVSASPRLPHHISSYITWKHTSSSVNKLGQNSRSSSRSKDRPASNRARKAVTAGASASSRMLLTPRN
jgi:hypothetical protein